MNGIDTDPGKRANQANTSVGSLTQFNSPNSALGMNGFVNGAYDFQAGFGQYLTVANHTNLNFGANQDLTIEATFKTDSATQTIWFKGIDPESSVGYGLRVNSGPCLVFFVNDGSHYNQTIDLVTNISDNQWHYVAGVRSDDTLYLYVDGILVDEKTDANISNSLINDQNPIIGRHYVPSQSRYYYFNGSIDFISISNIARTDLEIYQRYLTLIGQ